MLRGEGGKEGWKLEKEMMVGRKKDEDDGKEVKRKEREVEKDC